MVLTVITCLALAIFVGWPVAWGIYMKATGAFNQHGAMEAFFFCLMPFVLVFFAVTQVWWKIFPPKSTT